MERIFFDINKNMCPNKVDNTLFFFKGDTCYKRESNKFEKIIKIEFDFDDGSSLTLNSKDIPDFEKYIDNFKKMKVFTNLSGPITINNPKQVVINKECEFFIVDHVDMYRKDKTFNLEVSFTYFCPNSRYVFKTNGTEKYTFDFDKFKITTAANFKKVSEKVGKGVTEFTKPYYADKHIFEDQDYNITDIVFNNLKEICDNEKIEYIDFKPESFFDFLCFTENPSCYLIKKLPLYFNSGLKPVDFAKLDKFLEYYSSYFNFDNNNAFKEKITHYPFETAILSSFKAAGFEKLDEMFELLKNKQIYNFGFCLHKKNSYFLQCFETFIEACLEYRNEDEIFKIIETPDFDFSIAIPFYMLKESNILNEDIFNRISYNKFNNYACELCKRIFVDESLNIVNKYLEDETPACVDAAYSLFIITDDKKKEDLINFSCTLNNLYGKYLNINFYYSPPTDAEAIAVVKFENKYNPYFCICSSNRDRFYVQDIFLKHLSPRISMNIIEQINALFYNKFHSKNHDDELIPF